MQRGWQLVGVLRWELQMGVVCWVGCVLVQAEEVDIGKILFDLW